ncbi:hypothetical protein AUJ66_08515 [Candidatus Desantisbacteria bacterium CG1_02_38_46]|uniref:Oxidoreductase n=3 Tax=unclassified Candidatus Desantisiibacteriota TaxID=3106372 RepID=A0A2H9PBE9_9BACT|nr:MAG: hypothetical protein AUJ66_08515 [Candidatus Desantisbacteria bacterium CG1_02_38_46]PIU52059.1 MAG: oxidoreductase [Candidatus Desantisbacteria bacterium CG07_land_8_20_14_0_80_39_15]PIZ16127.1 MAG: oxidoreductase [Candidatus Desantisbacteria bacterium CG_4_10_14_0_8_um_filter_39_17]
MDKVRIGVVGCGGMGQGHIKSIKELPEAELGAVSDVDEETVKKTSRENGVKGFTDYNELINSSLVDAVVIATPHYFHPPVGIAAFEKGLHVLSEKPIAVTVSAVDEFLKAAKKSGKVFAVMYQLRTSPAIRLARKIVKDGRLGEIKRTIMLDPNYRSQAYYSSAGWRGTWKGEGGGVLINQAPHGIDLFMLLGGLPVRVSASVRTRLHKIEVEDEASAVLEYANGAWGYYYTSTCEMPYTQRIEICGDKGKLVYADGILKMYSVNPSISQHNATNQNMWTFPEVKEEPLELQEVESGHKEIMRNFCAAILHGEEVIASGEEGVWSVEFINAVNLSGRLCKPVNIPVNRKEYDNLMDSLIKSSQEKTAVKVQRVTDPRISK